MIWVKDFGAAKVMEIPECFVYCGSSITHRWGKRLAQIAKRGGRGALKLIEWREVMEVQKIATLSDELKSFIQSGNYEPYILDLMNRSKVIFPGQYAKNEDQSNNQCDFYDVQTCEKYEAKLPFDKKEGNLICSDQGSFKKWLEFMMDEEAEFGEKIILKRGKYSVDSLRLYKTMEKRLKTVQEDENAVILFPYPISLDLEGDDGLNLLHFCGDILSSIFGKLKDNGVVGSRKVYVIYPSADGKMVLRCLNTNRREYLMAEDLSKVFAYSFSLL